MSQSNSLFSFSSQSMLILGASCEIGWQLAKMALSLNIKLTLACRNPKELQEKWNKEVTTTLSSTTSTPEFVLFDLAHPETFENYPYKTFDLLVDLAHPNYECLFAAQDIETAQTYIQEALIAKNQLLKWATRGMMSHRKGRLVYLSSTATERMNPGQSLYASTKAACEKLYEGIGIELGKKGITTAILRAGYIDAGRGHQFIQEADDSEKILSAIPTHRPLSAVEVAQNLLFLCSDAAMQINATVLTLDGGLSAAKMI